MAESQPSLSSFKEHFDDQLTCSVCLDQYTDPKVLPYIAFNEPRGIIMNTVPPFLSHY